jgi:ketosteroid isomerase-like protein
MDTKQVGDRLVALCREGKNIDAISELYSPDITSVEAMGGDGTMSREMNGLDAVRGKNQWWYENHEVHSANTDGPYPHDDRFAVKFSYDITAKSGPMAGNRFTMNEVALYTVKDGKIVREEFFYAM